VAYDEERNSTYTYDPEKAKELVAEIGTIPEFPLTFVGANPVYAATAQIVQANLADVGIPVKLDPVDAANFVGQLIGAEFKGLWTTYHSWAQHTPSTLTVSAYPFNANSNASHYVDETYQKDSNDAWQVQDGTSPEAIEAYTRISDDLLESLFLIEIGVVVEQWVTGSEVEGVRYTRRSEPDVTNAYFE
jgi:peptide/nickel transport system substrate-binding protein